MPRKTIAGLEAELRAANHLIDKMRECTAELKSEHTAERKGRMDAEAERNRLLALLDTVASVVDARIAVLTPRHQMPPAWEIEHMHRSCCMERHDRDEPPAIELSPEHKLLEHIRSEVLSARRTPDRNGMSRLY